MANEEQDYCVELAKKYLGCYNKDFEKWTQCYKDLIEALFEIFEIDSNTKTFKYRRQTPSITNMGTLIDAFFKNNDKNIVSFLVAFNKLGVKQRRELAQKIFEKPNATNKKDCLETGFLGVPGGQQGLSKSNVITFDSNKIKQALQEKNSNSEDIHKKLNKFMHDLLKNNFNQQSFNKFIDDMNLPNSFKNACYLLDPTNYAPVDEKTTLLLNQNSYLQNNTSQDHKDYWFAAVSLLAYRKFSTPLENELEAMLIEGQVKNIVLTGIPGTGKTHSVMEFLKERMKDDGPVAGYRFVQFHPSYDYEDFIEGMRPMPGENGNIEFKLVDGVFKELCKEAYLEKQRATNSKKQPKLYVMVIDEINRANLSRVFGELLYCLEYRDEFVNTKMTTYIKENRFMNRSFVKAPRHQDFGKFCIPSNVVVIGTMNDVDRSIDAFDLALRRRFLWLEMVFDERAIETYEGFCDHNSIDGVAVSEIVERAKKLNDKIAEEMGKNYSVGHTYYLKIADYWKDGLDQAMEALWRFHLRSLLQEYLKMRYAEHEIEDKLKAYKAILIPQES